MSPSEVITWVQQQEQVALAASRFWVKEALTIVVVDVDRVAVLARVMPRAFAGVEGGAVVVCHWVRDNEGDEPRAHRWHIASADDEFVATFGPHDGRFPHQQAQELSS